MAHKLGLKVIASGIDTRQQQQILVDVHRNHGQGFLFAEPLPPDEFQALLEENMAAVCRPARAKP
jgi:EAL domain-containing protein (putative c-di-GMP-specific phosphodiesterase class I)